MVNFFPTPNNKIITCGKALHNIEPSEIIKLTDKYGKLWHRLKPGQNASHILGMGQNNCVILNPEKPACTLPKMQGGKGFATICHWKENRAIAINEALILSSFPENWKMTGKYSEKWARIGNAVMPKFMQSIAENIKINILKKENPTVISTFAGTGGSSLGYKLAGYKELLAIDNEPHATECFKLNFPGVPCWTRSVFDVDANDIFNNINIKRGELDVFDGSPPCQGFSTAGKRQVSDPRNDLFKRYMYFVEQLQPKVFVMENVTGMVKGKFKGKFIEIMRQLKSLDYEVKCKQMNSKYYGVPQSRERLIFIGVRNDVYKSLSEK